MPTIIAAHIAKTNANSIACHGMSAGAMISMPDGIMQAGHVHAAHAHVGREPEHVAPRQRGDHSERAGNDQTISLQHRLQGAVGHLSGMSPALPTGRFTKKASRLI